MKNRLKVAISVMSLICSANAFGSQLVSPVPIELVYNTGPDFDQVELRNRTMVKLIGAVWNDAVTCATDYLVIPEGDSAMTSMILATYFAGQKLFVGTNGLKVWGDRCQISYAHPVK